MHHFQVGICAISLAFTLSPMCAHAQGSHARDACSLKNVAEDASVVRMPIDVVDGRAYVQVRVNGKGPFRFAVDTGASGDARVDMVLVRSLGLPRTGAGTSADAIQTAAVEKVSLESLALGGLEKKHLQVTARDYRFRTAAEFSGILARDFFADGLLVLDFPNRMLTFSPSSSLPRQAAGAIGYEKAFRIPVQIGQQRVLGNLDTGADVSFVLPMSLYARVQATPLVDAGNASLTNTTSRMKSTTIHDTIRIGTEAFTGADARVVDGFPELLIGSRVISRYVVLIDQRTQTLALCK